MRLKETPPRSPEFISAPMEPEEEADELDEADVVEVIDVSNEATHEELVDDEEQEEDNSMSTLKSHSGSIFCCDISSDNKWLGSGGEDNCLHVHDASSLKLVFNTQDLFKDSVSECVFSSKLLAAGDLSGAVRVFKTYDNDDHNNAWTILWQFDTSDITWLRWHPKLPNVLFAATEASELWMWKVSTGDSKLYMGNGEKAESAAILSDGKKMGVGYGDGSMRIFDLKSGNCVHTLNSGSSAGHEGAVIDMDASDNGLMASASADGFAKVLSVQSGKNVALFRGQEHRAPADPSDETDNNSSFESVEQVLFSFSSHLLITATLEGVLVVWDMATKVARHRLNLSAGVTRLMWRSKDNINSLLVVAKLDGGVDVVDVRLGTVLATCKKHEGPVLDIAISPDGHRLLTGSDDETCKVFDLKAILKENDDSQNTSGAMET